MVTQNPSDLKMMDIKPLGSLLANMLVFVVDLETWLAFCDVYLLAPSRRVSKSQAFIPPKAMNIAEKTSLLELAHLSLLHHTK